MRHSSTLFIYLFIFQCEKCADFFFLFIYFNQPSFVDPCMAGKMKRGLCASVGGARVLMSQGDGELVISS